MTERILIFLMRVALVVALLAGTYLATTTGGTTVTEAINDKFAHLLGFYLLAVLADLSFPRVTYGLHKIAPLIGYGLLIEIIQWLLPYRTFSMLDLAADGAGLFCYGLTLLLLRRFPSIGPRRWLITRDSTRI
jgi:VanZ family protein